MWFGQMPPWMRGAMGQGQQTPGSGMPPVGGGQGAYGRPPMNMNPVQMGQPSSVPGGAPPMPGQQQQPINPAQMGMLSQLMAQQTPKPPGAPMQANVMPGAQGAVDDSGIAQGANFSNPAQMGMLAQLLRSMGIG